MPDDLERTIERSLSERSSALDPGDGSLDDVMHRVDRRHHRRRATAVAGSLAVIAIGLVGKFLPLLEPIRKLPPPLRLRVPVPAWPPMAPLPPPVWVMASAPPDTVVPPS